MKLPNMNIRKINWNYLALAFLCPFVGMLLVMLFGGAAPFGRHSMLYCDMYHQYYPFFVAFRRTILSGGNLLFSWDVGLGMDYLGLVAYYVASPLNLLSLLVPEQLLLNYFSLLMPVKLGLAGLFFAFFLKNLFGKNDFSIVLFGGFYATCAWALGYQWNVMWLDTFALLPLVTLGMVRLLKDRKFVLYTFTLFLSIFANYYVGLFTCIFIFLCFFCYELCCWKGFKRFFQDLCWIAGFSALAIAMTAILELPAFFSLRATSSVGELKIPTDQWINKYLSKNNNFQGLLESMRKVAGNMNGGLVPNFKEHTAAPNIYCGIFANILGLLFFTCPRIKLREKLCCLGLLLLFMLSFVIKQLDFIWHGFHNPNMIPYRFSYLFCFVLLYMAYRAWLHRKSFRPWQVVMAGILAVGIFLCSDELLSFVDILLGKKKGKLLAHLAFPAYNMVFGMLYLVALLFGSWLRRLPKKEDKPAVRDYFEELRFRRRLSSALLLGVIAGEFALNMISFGISFPFTSDTATYYPRGKGNTADVIQQMYSREEDNLFFRAETTLTQTYNDGALNGYNGVTTFTSSANAAVTKFMKGLGFAGEDSWNRYSYETSSPVANLFLNLKYLIHRETSFVAETSFFQQVYAKGNVKLLENQYYLPLGFLTDSRLGQMEWSRSTNGYSVFAFQNTLLRNATGLRGDVWNTLTLEDPVLAEEQIYGRTVHTQTYTYEIGEEGFLCFHLDFVYKNREYSITLNGTKIVSDTYASLPQLIAGADVKPGDVVQIKVHGEAADTKGIFTVVPAILDKELFQQAYDILSASTLELTEFSNTVVAGTITCDRDGLLYTSIPQDGKWTATVDGAPAQIQLVGKAMVGLELTEGTHEVRFTYENSAFTWGVVLSIVSWLIFGALYVLIYRPAMPKGKYAR